MLLPPTASLKPACIALLTDFGEDDSYAGVLRGVLTTLSPKSPIVDLSHRIPAGDVRRGAIMLWEAQPFFPVGTCFLAVVDPGVGGGRKGMILSTADCVFIGPDNGLATFLLERASEWAAYELTEKAYRLDAVSNTFHGRDIFAPAAARAAVGVPPSAFGPPIEAPVRIAPPRLSGDSHNGWEGEILHADWYGNLITSIGVVVPDHSRLKPWIGADTAGQALFPRARLALPDGTKIPLLRTYSDCAPGVPSAVVGGSGLVEIVLPGARAADLPGMIPGGVVRLNPTE